MTPKAWSWWLGAMVVGIPLMLYAMPETLRIPKAKEHGKGEPPDAAVFSHWAHDGYYCYSCHPSIFPKARVGFTHEDMDQGKFCGACHNGKVSWAIDAMEVECETCHREESP